MKPALERIARKQVGKLRLLKAADSAESMIKGASETSIDKRVDRLFHNLRSIYAHCTQLTESILPISGRGDATTAIRQLETFLSSEPSKAALLIFKLNKQIIALGTELTTYNMLNGASLELEACDIGIYGMVRNVASGFFAELNEKKNYINIDNSYVKAHFDFQTIEVALYYIIENAVKYVLPNSKIHVSFESTTDWEIVRFRMTSLYVDPNEVDRIFDEGYSGNEAIKGRLQGKGLGMYQARKLTELNGGTLNFVAGKQIKSRRDGLRYAENVVVVKLPKAEDED